METRGEIEITDGKGWVIRTPIEKTITQRIIIVGTGEISNLDKPIIRSTLYQS